MEVTWVLRKDDNKIQLIKAHRFNPELHKRLFWRNFLGSALERFRAIDLNNPWIRDPVIGIVCIVFGLILQPYLLPHPEPELYRSLQTVTIDGDNPPVNPINLDGSGILVPLYVESLEAAHTYGIQIGEPDKLFRNRVVVMALDPAMRYADLPEGRRVSSAYDSSQVYTFYVPDGEVIKDPAAREKVISIGEKRYKIVLLSISNVDDAYSYQFRIEEIDE